MKKCIKACFTTFLFLFTTLSLLASESLPVTKGTVTAQLISSVQTTTPQSRVSAGLKLVHEKGWHTYWVNTETGYAPSIDWTLPEGWKVSGFTWPVPNVHGNGYTVDNIFEGEVILPFIITVPEKVKLGTYQLKGLASWLMCKDICVPANDIELVLTIHVGEERIADKAHLAELDEAIARLPKSFENWKYAATRDDKKYGLGSRERREVFMSWISFIFSVITALSNLFFNNL